MGNNKSGIEVRSTSDRRHACRLTQWFHRLAPPGLAKDICFAALSFEIVFECLLFFRYWPIENALCLPRFRDVVFLTTRPEMRRTNSWIIGVSTPHGNCKITVT